MNGVRFKFNQNNLIVCKDLHDLNQSARLTDRRKTINDLVAVASLNAGLPTTIKRAKMRGLVSATLQWRLFCLCIALLYKLIYMTPGSYLMVCIVR